MRCGKVEVVKVGRGGRWVIGVGGVRMCRVVE